MPTHTYQIPKCYLFHCLTSCLINFHLQSPQPHNCWDSQITQGLPMLITISIQNTTGWKKWRPTMLVYKKSHGKLYSLTTSTLPRTRKSMWIFLSSKIQKKENSKLIILCIHLEPTFFCHTITDVTGRNITAYLGKGNGN